MTIHDITRLIVLLTADSIYDRCETVCFAAVFSGEMMDEAYRKFKETGQEALRLKIALEQLLGRDREMLPQEVRTEYERYLKKRNPSGDGTADYERGDGSDRASGKLWMVRRKRTGQFPG